MRETPGWKEAGGLVEDERLRNQLLLVASVVKGSDGCLDSVGGVRESCAHARTHARAARDSTFCVGRNCEPEDGLCNSHLELLPL